MKLRTRWRLGLAVLLALGAAGARAQAGASPATSVLPSWAQDRLAALRTDPKAFEAAYRQGAKLAAFCANCHGPNGQSVRPDVPNLAGQNTAYVLTQITKFGEGKRRGAFFMEGLVKAMSNDERFAVAVYYTNQEPVRLPVKDATLAARGKQVYENICKACHGERGAGNEVIARVAGQQPEYLAATIKRYREGVRMDERMLVNVRSLTDADIRAVTAYIGSL